MEEDERRKIDLKKYALSPVSRRYLLRISMYVVLLTVLSWFTYYLYSRDPEPRKVKSPTEVQEIRGVTLSDSL
ncbi:MAG: hypothetical protein HRT58_08635 [Crocinitomicaceae bacterium]|nr:hypothetical protein [Flavobacteriales bacterium]NQZ35716.1 hypothetical protein [Crocinitomicaceae bacterium]